MPTQIFLVMSRQLIDGVNKIVTAAAGWVQAIFLEQVHHRFRLMTPCMIAAFHARLLENRVYPPYGRERFHIFCSGPMPR